MQTCIFGKLLGSQYDVSISRHKMASSLSGNAVPYAQDSDDLHSVFGTTGIACDLVILPVLISVTDRPYDLELSLNFVDVNINMPMLQCFVFLKGYNAT